MEVFIFIFHLAIEIILEIFCDIIQRNETSIATELVKSQIFLLFVYSAIEIDTHFCKKQYSDLFSDLRFLSVVSAWVYKIIRCHNDVRLHRLNSLKESPSSILALGILFQKLKNQKRNVNETEQRADDKPKKNPKKQKKKQKKKRIS